MCLILMKILTTKMQQGGLPTNIWIKEAKGRKLMHIAHMKNQGWKCPWKGKFGQLMCTNFFTKRETIWAQKSMAWWVTQPSWKWIRMVHIAHLKIKIRNVPRHGTKMGNLWVSFFPTNWKKNHSYLRMMVDDLPSPQRKRSRSHGCMNSSLEDHPFEVDNIKGKLLRTTSLPQGKTIWT